MITELKKQEKDIKEKIKMWEFYETSKKKYYNIPYPNELEYLMYNQASVNKDNINQYKGKLNYLKTVAEYYDNNDFIIDIECFIGGFTIDYLKSIQITPTARAKLHNIIKNLENKIIEVEKTINN